jgi:hypothetical protein
MVSVSIPNRTSLVLRSGATVVGLALRDAQQRVNPAFVVIRKGRVVTGQVRKPVNGGNRWLAWRVG